MKNRTASHQIVRLAALASLIALLLNSCTLSLIDPSGILPPTPSLPFPIPPTATPQPNAEVTFEVSLPSPLLPGEELVLSIVDEVTGLALNATNYPLQGKDALHYTLALPLPVNSVGKYRYLRQTTLPILEDNSADQAVRYRMVYVTGRFQCRMRSRDGPTASSQVKLAASSVRWSTLQTERPSPTSW